MAERDIERERSEIDAEIGEDTLCHLLLRNAERHGGAPAISWKTNEEWKSSSWSELREQVLTVAAGLASLGVGRGDYVALMACNRPEHVLADLGALHAGGTPSTFYSTLATDQIRYVAKNCGAKVAVLENRDYLERWKQIRGELPALSTIVLMDDADAAEGDEMVLTWDELLARGRASRDGIEDRWRTVKPGDPATLIYTSGTTGPPKGVVLTHRSCVWEAASIDRLTGIPNGLTLVSYLPMAHIAERLLSIYLPLRKAMHVFFCPDPKLALNYVHEARPALFFGVPRVWEKVRAGLTAKLEAEPNPRKRRLALAALDAGLRAVKLEQQGRSVPLGLRLKRALLERLVLGKIRLALGLDRCEFAASAAAPLPVDVAEFFAGLGLPLHEFYGMTETTGVATGNPLGHAKIGSVGTALPGVDVKLAGDGEILVRGPCCTSGYLNRPESTAELIDEEGWLHTGDIGAVSDGYYRIVDRKKELIITSSGKNISPANIEALLKEHPLVGQALAYGDRKPYVVALIVLDGEVAPEWARQNDVEFETIADLVKNETVREEIRKAVDTANAKLARIQQVKRHRILPAEWTPESEELTPTMKLKRRVIEKKYAGDIETLYASA